MNIDLTPELEKLVQNKLRSGGYDSVGEMLSEALRLLDQRDKIFAIRKGEYRQQIEEGWLAAEQGDFVDGDQVFDRIDGELAAAELAAPQPKRDDHSGRG